jgi:hypothetical protein
MENEYLHPGFIHVLNYTDQERIRFLHEPRWIGYSKANKIIETMRDLMERPVKSRMTNLLLVGDPNNGKTTIINRFKELHGKDYVNSESEAVKPVIIVESPPSADEKGLYISILEKFWTPYKATAPTNKLRYQVLHLMRQCHVRALVVDEFHSLLTGTATKQREVMNCIKFLCNELKIPIIGVGTLEAIRVLHTDPQHASRFDVSSLKTWEQNAEFQRLLVSFERILPLKRSSKLHNPELASLLYSISAGNIGNLHRLLIECSIEAINSNTEQITKEIISSKKWLRPTKGIRELKL